MKNAFFAALSAAALLCIAGCETGAIQPTKENSPLLADPDGIYKPLKFTKNDKGIVVDRRLDCYAPLVLRVR